MPRFATVLLGLCLPFTASATVTFNVDASLLKNQSGVLIPEGTGLLILAASTTDGTFADPTDTGFFSGDDIELARWSMTTGFGAGIFNETTGGLTLSGSWNVGDPLQLYWFPSLTTGASQPSSGSRYGTYRHPTGLDGSDPWVTPSDFGGPTVTLNLLTPDNGGNGSNPNGNAIFTVVPEPAEYAALAGVACLAWGLLARKRKAAAQAS